MIEVRLDAASVARVRVCASPILEVVSLLCLAARGERHPVFGDVGAGARFALRNKDVATVAALLTGTEARGYLPDFVIPKPAGDSPDESFARQLERVRGTPTRRANQEVRAAWPGASPAMGRLSDVDLPALVASGLATFWANAMGDVWPHVAHVVSNQVHELGQVAVSRGVGAMLSGAHPGLSWAGTSVLVDKHTSRTFAFEDAELVLVPSLLSSTRLTVQLDDPSDAWIAYPFTARPRRREQAPARLLGRGRSRVLLALRTPATTREVAGRVALTEATVSHHLHALADAGLVHGTRRGQRVVYALTAVAHELVDVIATTD